MNLIEFFGTTIKPKQTNGKKLWCPCETSQINENLFAIRDKDVNLFLIKSETGYIAIDSGYKNSENVRNGLKELQISPTEIKAVFLTHLDLDHAGGVDAYSEPIFPNCDIYLSSEEEQYLTGKLFRKKILGIGLASPIQLSNTYKLADDNQTFTVDGVTITAISTPGHTMGHTSYLVSDELLFVGDLLIIGDDGGYCFMDFWNADSSINMVSLEKAYTIATKKEVAMIITSHSGISNNIEFAFQHRLEMPAWKEKGFVFRKDAPENPYTNT